MNRPEQPGPVAETLRQIVLESPGIHFRGLGRAANLSSVGQLRHHLDRLQRKGAIVEVSDGQFKRYFAPGQYNASAMPILARFSRRMTRRIGALLLERPMRRVELRRLLRCADSTLGYHLNRMVATGDLRRVHEGEVRYELVEPDVVRDLLRAPTERPRYAHGLAADTARDDASATNGGTFGPGHGVFRNADNVKDDQIPSSSVA